MSASADVSKEVSLPYHLRTQLSQLDEQESCHLELCIDDRLGKLGLLGTTVINTPTSYAHVISV